jgi:hypothetical protein
MYKTKTVYPKYQNNKLSLLFLVYWIFKKKFIFYIIFLPIAALITWFFNLMKKLGLQKAINRYFISFTNS